VSELEKCRGLGAALENLSVFAHSQSIREENTYRYNVHTYRRGHAETFT